MNINGNWNVGTSIMFNTALDSEKHFNLMNFANINYSNNVGYMSTNVSGLAAMDIYRDDNPTKVDMDKVFRNVPLEKSTTKNTNLNDNLRLNYRNDFGESGTYEIGLNSGFNYQHARNKLQTNANVDSWTFNYGGNFNITFPWNMSLSTDISEQCRRGYSDESMNTNELIWNGQLSKSFLRNKSLIVALNFYDLLGQQSNYERWVNATGRSDTQYNSVNSYAMLHVRYRLNMFGGKIDTEGRYDKKWGNRDQRNNNQRGGGGGNWRR